MLFRSHVCNKYGNLPAPGLAKFMAAQQLATVVFPPDGVLSGDWQRGEEIAQSGRGFTWTDKPGLPGGGLVVNVPLPAGTGSEPFRAAYRGTAAGGDRLSQFEEYSWTAKAGLRMFSKVPTE